VKTILQRFSDDEEAQLIAAGKTLAALICLSTSARSRSVRLSSTSSIFPAAISCASFSDDEEAQLIAAGKIDEVLDKRTERLRADVDKQIKASGSAPALSAALRIASPRTRSRNLLENASAFSARAFL
jgi:hypothetical protein